MENKSNQVLPLQEEYAKNFVSYTLAQSLLALSKNQTVHCETTARQIERTRFALLISEGFDIDLLKNQEEKYLQLQEIDEQLESLRAKRNSMMDQVSKLEAKAERLQSAVNKLENDIEKLQKQAIDTAEKL